MEQYRSVSYRETIHFSDTVQESTGAVYNSEDEEDIGSSALCYIVVTELYWTEKGKIQLHGRLGYYI